MVKISRGVNDENFEKKIFQHSGKIDVFAIFGVPWTGNVIEITEDV